MIYLLLLPAIIWYVVFCYYPMYGILLAFKDYQFNKGIMGSPWVGMRYLVLFFQSMDFTKIISNTLLISSLKLVVGFPAPIILSLMLNEVRKSAFKRSIQTITYLPYFVSWVVVMTLFSKLLSPYDGIVNDIKISLFGGSPIYFMNEKSFFYPLVLLTDVWKNVGWSSIIYLAAISNIGVDLYESAVIDGAGRFKSMIHITLPGMKPTIGILFILSMGSLMRAGFDQIYLMQNPGVLDVAEILDTYVLKVGIMRGYFGYATAIGLFQSVISIALIIITNQISKRVSEISIW